MNELTNIDQPSAGDVEKTTAPVKRPRGRPRKNPVVEQKPGKPGQLSPSVKVQSGKPAQLLPSTKVQSGKPIAHRVIRQKISTSAPPIESQAIAALSSVAVTPLQYIFTVGRRKRAVARVFCHKEGTGEIEINSKSFDKYFVTPQLQQIIQSALDQSSLKYSLRFIVKVRGGGPQGQAYAVRLGIVRALVKLDESLRPIFRARGYLTRDPREKERKKPGLKKARRAPQWQKR